MCTREKYRAKYQTAQSPASVSMLLKHVVDPFQVLCLEIEQTQKASDPAELQRWSQLSSRARDELSTLQCILGSLKDNQVEELVLKCFSATVSNFTLVLCYALPYETESCRYI